MRPSPLALRQVCALLSTVLLATLLVTVGAPPMARDLERTSGWTYLCSGYAGCRESGYSDGGYGRVNQRMYWNMYSGHNCTNYVAYRIITAGGPSSRPFGYPGNATNWGQHRSDITDQRPQVGAVAWWKAYDNGSGSAGHVAYVERVQDNGNTIVISEDNWGGTFHWRRISKSSGRWPTGFIHFVDRAIENTRRPRVRGTAKLGEELFGSNGQWRPRGVKKDYKWFADGEVIQGARSQRLTVGPALVGKRISHRVKVRKDGWQAATKWSRKTAPVQPGEITVTEEPVVTGTPAKGETLMVDPGTFAPTPAERRIQWLADGQPIDGADRRRLTLTKQQAGKRISAKVTAQKRAYRKKSAVSEPTEWVRNGTMRIKESATVKGWPVVGGRLTVKPGLARPNWNVETRYQWLRDGQPIEAATGRRYRLTPADFDRSIAAQVTYSNPRRFGASETVVENRTIRARPEMRTRTKVKGKRNDKVVIVAKLTDPAVSTVSGRVSVGFAGRWKTQQLRDGAARFVFRKIAPGTRRAAVRFHNNEKFVRAVQRPWIKVPK